MFNWVYLIPITAIVFGIGIGALGMWTDHKRKSQMLEQAHRERMAAIERGVDLPTSKFEPVDNSATPAARPANPAKVLRSGVLLLALGIVLYFAIGEAGGREGALFGLIPATVGLANLAYALVLFRNEQKADAARDVNRLPPL